MGTTSLVIENKVDAPEQPTQCEDLYREWGPDALYLLLSPSGNRPLSCLSKECIEACRTLSYGSLERLLTELAPSATGPGAKALEGYIQTLREQFPATHRFVISREGDMDRSATDPVADRFEAPNPFDSPRLRFYLEHQAEIEQLKAIEVELKSLLKREFDSMLGPILAVLLARYGPVAGCLGRWKDNRSDHPLIWRPEWTDEAGNALAGVGIAADSWHSPPGQIYVGLFAPEMPGLVRGWLKNDFGPSPRDGWVPGVYPVAYRYLAFDPSWWRDVPAWRQSLADAVVGAWDRFAPRIDEAVAATRATRG
jgi:hypothetical protein